VRHGRAELTPVEVGHSNGRETVVIRGLAVGEEVVIQASDKVADGAKIPTRGR
jgi:hypothetical protein